VGYEVSSIQGRVMAFFIHPQEGYGVALETLYKHFCPVISILLLIT
jgi:hypothetical protein